MLTYWTNLYNNAGRIFFNMIEMMKNIWSGLWNFIRGRGFDIDFSPMVDSFNAATEGIKMPELAAPQLDALSGDLDRIAGQLAARQDARRRRAADAAKATGDNSIAALEIQEGTEKEITAEKEKQKELSTSFVSLADLADQGIQSSLEAQREEETRRNDEAFANNRIAPQQNADLIGQLADALTIEQSITPGTLGQTQATGDAIPSFVGTANQMQDALAALRGNQNVRDEIRPAGEMANGMASREQISAMQRQINMLQAILELARGPGIRIAQQAGSVNLPAASVQFAGVPG
jgi:hypothetical protein